MVFGPAFLYVALHGAVLAIVQNVPAAQYDDQVEPREALLRGLTLNQ